MHISQFICRIRATATRFGPEAPRLGNRCLLLSVTACRCPAYLTRQFSCAFVWNLFETCLKLVQHSPDAVRGLARDPAKNAIFLSTAGTANANTVYCASKMYFMCMKRKFEVAGRRVVWPSACAGSAPLPDFHATFDGRPAQSRKTGASCAGACERRELSRSGSATGSRS